MRPIVWTIAGSDSSGGAGIQADLKTMHALGVYGCSVITAVTAQNTLGVRRVDYLSADLIEAQLNALQDDLPPAAVKIGMLGTPSAVRAVAGVLRKLHAFLAYDPVMGSSGGFSLSSDDFLPAMTESLLPLVDLITPNIPEAERLTGRAVRTTGDMPEIAQALLALGPRSVLLKGGHLEPNEFCQDYWTNGRDAWWLTSPRQNVRHTHGTGCTFSSAAAAFHALGCPLPDALVLAKAYVNQGLRCGEDFGRGRAPLAHGGWPEHPDDAPWLTSTAEEGRSRPAFPDCGRPIGLYAIVDRAAWLKKIIPLGVDMIQLRAKDLDEDALNQEVAEAVRLAHSSGVRLVINDRADLALKHGAWGVHLGSEDLPHADLRALASAGLRVGISVRSWAELARALALQPSYVGIGAIYSTPSKAIDYAPLGVETFAKMRRWCRCPAVAIGGITVENAAPLRAAGADGLAVISDLRQAADLAARVRQWQAVFAV